MTYKVKKWQTETEGAAAPNCRQGQEQPQHQDAVGQRHIHLNWSNFKPEFSGKSRRGCRSTSAMLK